MNRNEIHGLLVLDKPGGMTSRDALNRVQKWFPRGTRVGHTGTLDPLATGVLVVCVGQATRLAEYVQAMHKTYRATFRLDARSDTDDADGTVVPVPGAQPLSLDQIDVGLQSFIGEIDQTPPAYSAAKVSGERSYDLARRGMAIELKPRRVVIYGIDTLSYSWPTLDVQVYCSKGTYIRSLARDLGARLSCGGMVQTLRRTRVGPFAVEDAVTLQSEPFVARKKLLPTAAAVADLPRIEVSAEDVVRLRHGQAIQWDGFGEFAVFEGNCLVAIGNVDEGGHWMRPSKVINY